jgi:hypothetical protein
VIEFRIETEDGQRHAGRAKSLEEIEAAIPFLTTEVQAEIERRYGTRAERQAKTAAVDVARSDAEAFNFARVITEARNVVSMNADGGVRVLAGLVEDLAAQVERLTKAGLEER